MPTTAEIRSPKACQKCRARKVRCDVATRGIPCSNCARSLANCSVQNARKSRLKSGTSKHNLPAENLFTFEASPHETNVIPINQVEQTSFLHEITTSDRLPLKATKVVPAQAKPSVNQEKSSDSLLLGLPRFVSPFPSDIDDDTLHLLFNRGCFAIPDPALLEEVMGVYTCYVHPLLPLLDMRQTLDGIHGKNGTTISLLLLHAIIFAASAFIDSAHITALGLGSRGDTRRALFYRVKLLYELDVEHDALVMIQALLLMTYWYGQQNDMKGRLYWLRTAVFLAIDIGLDREGQQPLAKSSSILGRRVWYCCLLREASLTLTERRAGLFQKCTKVPSLTWEDFEDPAFNEALNLYYMPESEPTASIIASLCVQNVELSLIMRRILDSQYQLTGIRRVNSSEIVMVLIPNRSSATTSKAVQLEEDLQKWRSRTAAIRGSRIGLDHRGNGRVLGVHSASLEMLYLTASSMVHRPLMLQEPEKDSAAATLQTFSQRELRTAARRVSEICRQLQDGNLMRFLPPLAVGAFIMSAVQHLKDAMSTNSDLCSLGHLYLSQTLDALSTLKDIYNSATCASEFIQRVKSGALPSRTFEWEASAESTARHDTRVSTLHNTLTGDSIDVNLDVANTPAGNVAYSKIPPLGFTVTQHASDDVNALNSLSGEYNGIIDERDLRNEDISDIFFSAALDMNQIEWIDSMFDRA